MSHARKLRDRRRPTAQTWVGLVVVALLLAAEAFAVVHQYDSAAHANGQQCAVCLSVASFGTGAVATPLQLDVVPVTPFVAILAAVVCICGVPARRYARGPPTVSFTS